VNGLKKRLKRIFGLLRPEEIIFLVFLFFAFLAVHYIHGLHGLRYSYLPRKIWGAFTTVWFLPALLIVLAVWIPSAVLKQKDRQGARLPRILQTSAAETLMVIRDFSSFIICIGLYSVMRNLVPVLNPHDADAVIAGIDFSLFGVNPFIWIRQFASPGLTRFLEFSYFSYFYTSPLLAAALYLQEKKDLFRNLMLSIVICSVIGNIGYLLVPVVGPQYVLRHMYGLSWEMALRTFPVPNFAKVTLNVSRDCFPSLHTAWTIITFYYCWKWKKIAALMYLPVALGLITATVYLAIHYFIDLPAGAVTAAAAILIAEKINMKQRPIKENLEGR